jgi:FkbH-like protein
MIQQPRSVEYRMRPAIWLPTASDFRADLGAALESRDSTDCLERLASLAQYRLGYLETLQLDRALGRLTLEPGSGFTSVRLAILASSTVDHLSPAIRVAGLRRRLMIDVHIGAYGQYRQNLLDPHSSLHQFAPQFVLFSITARDAIAGMPLTATSVEVEETIAQSLQELRLLWHKARENFNATIIQQTFLDITEPVFGSYDRLVPGAPAQVITQLNDQLLKAAAQDSVLPLDIARASERDGIDAWFDAGNWLHGKLEIAPEAATLYGDMVVRVVGAQRGLSKKCLVFDLDNTLWGGVIGDDGLEGLILGEGSAVGEAHLALQRYAKQLKERGVILAVCSKNDPATAEAAFNDHPEMLLKRSDISAFVANWDDKAENLKGIAAQLNIGLDSLVFVDDNPVERARIRQSLPMVAVPELPTDVAHYVRCLAGAGYFEAVYFTSEDRLRTAQYAANAQRQSLFELLGSLDDFLRNLQMSVVFGPFAATDLVRLTQLFNKTNQFNTTTRRYSAEEVAHFAAAEQAVTLQFRLLDKYGDNGLVSAMILHPDPKQLGIFEIDNWVMSCRVFGRRLEYEAMNIAVEQARRRGGKALRADYIPTPKNAVISELYSSLGFSTLNDGTPKTAGTCWFLDLTKYIARSTHISRSGELR